MKRISKRLLSLLLVMITLVSIALPMTAEAAATTSTYPIVYVRGRRTPIYNKNGKQIYPATRISSKEGGSGMASKPELWKKQDDGTVNREFMLAYERSVLLSLQEQGILTQQQYEECVRTLERK